MDAGCLVLLTCRCKHGLDRRRVRPTHRSPKVTHIHCHHTTTPHANGHEASRQGRSWWGMCVRGCGVREVGVGGALYRRGGSDHRPCLSCRRQAAPCASCCRGPRHLRAIQSALTHSQSCRCRCRCRRWADIPSMMSHSSRSASSARLTSQHATARHLIPLPLTACATVGATAQQHG